MAGATTMHQKLQDIDIEMFQKLNIYELSVCGFSDISNDNDGRNLLVVN